MKPSRKIFNIVPLILLILNPLMSAFLSVSLLAADVDVVNAASATQPVVAIHVSEYTQVLETTDAVSPTPTGSGASGKEWWVTSWHYSVIVESLKLAFESDGTPYKIVTDADIAAGGLMDGTSPKYPIVFSLAAEAIDNTEVNPLRNYVDAGGFLLVGSSAFTRNIDGTTRGDFALADEMGLNMVNPSLQNWGMTSNFTHFTNQRIVSHIPVGTVAWNMLTNAEDIVWGTNGAQQQWQVNLNGAEEIASGDAGPLLATKGYGQGRFIYHAILNPLIGAGGYDVGMYAYTIYRSAVEWAFEEANLPLVKRSPWPFAYNAAFMARHDYEDSLGLVGGIEASAAYEKSVNVKGEYYFCTGRVRELDETTRNGYVESMRRAITNYGATIGSHNGGFPNIGVADNWAYDYWHWGPDTMIDQTTGFPDVLPYGPYTSGYSYAKDSIERSFDDLEGWFANLDNGRVGCGVLDICPRTWVSPYFNSGRDRSFKILEEVGSITMGEQKISPFPHWTLSYDPANPDPRYNHLTLPPSDWYVGNRISQSMEDGHSIASVQALVDFYYQKGYLINMYGHQSSLNGPLMRPYIDYNLGKPNIWATNAVGLHDWWQKRDALIITPTFTKVGNSAQVTVGISGSDDEGTAIEVVLPYWSSGAVKNLVVKLDGEAASESAFRTTDYGVKIKVGIGVANVQVDYTPLEDWVQTDWVGGAEQSVWGDEAKYESASGINDGVAGQLSLPLATAGEPLFSDDFNRTPPPDPEPVPFDWITSPIPGNYGIFNTMGGTLNTSLSSGNQYGFAYKGVPGQPAGNYTVETDIRFPNTTNGGGIFGRLDPNTGSRYAVWIYPPTNLRLIRFNIWPGSPWVNLGDYTIPSVGTGWHHLKLTFNETNIQVFYDRETLTHNVTDSTYANGFAGLDYWSETSNGPSYNNYEVKDLLGNVIFSDNFGGDPDVPNLLEEWTIYTGGWSVVDLALRNTTGGTGGYGTIYYKPPAPVVWTNYSLQAKLQFPSGAYGGGLAGRVNSDTGARYGVWVYPATSTLSLIKFTDWGHWTNTPLASASIVLDQEFHSVKVDFSGNLIRVYWDGNFKIEYTDNNSPYTSGGIGLDSYNGSASYLMKVDDVEVVGPIAYETEGELISSAFDGGAGAEWYSVNWYASIPSSTSLCVQTRTADRQDLLAAESWSTCYTTSGADVTSLDRRWIQYKVSLSSTDTGVTPTFSEIGITYTPGDYLPQSILSINLPTSGDSQTTVNLSAELLDESNNPIVGRILNFNVSGLGSFAANTGSNGIATVSLPLNIAPGIYPLTVTFASDGVYGPSMASTNFTVTENWSEWIQDSSANFGTGSRTGVDIEAISGSVILQSQQFGQGEESGPFQLDSETYSHRHKLLIDNPNTESLPSGYSLKLVLNSAALVSVNKLQQDGDDLRIVWLGGGTPFALDRVADTAFNISATELWFKSQAAIPAASVDGNYYIYYGNSSAVAGPSNPANVFDLYDGFDDSEIDTTKWTVGGSVATSSGWAQLSTGGYLHGKQYFQYGALEMRIQAHEGSDYRWWGWEDGIAEASNFIVFEEFPPNGLRAFLRNDGGSYLPGLSLIQQPTGGLTIPHIYSTVWRPGQATWYVDGTQVQAAAGIPDSSMAAIFNANQLGFDLDWVRGRKAAALEPTVDLAEPYEGFVDSGTFLSAPYDTGASSDWKYLVWESDIPAGTSLTLKLRTAASEKDLTSASWVPYLQTGLWITNTAAQWVQYQAELTTNNSSVTPELKKVVIYYSNTPTVVEVANFAAQRVGDTIQLTWDTATEVDLIGFNIYRSAGSSLTRELLTSTAISAISPGSTDGNSYSFIDTTPEKGVLYTYWLEGSDTSGTETFGPLQIGIFDLFLPIMIK